MAKTFQRQNSHVRSISLPCGPVCVKDEYNKLMGQLAPSSPTAEALEEEDAIDQTPPSSSRCGLPFMLTSMVFIFIAIAMGMSRYSDDGFWLTAKKRMLMYR